MPLLWSALGLAVLAALVTLLVKLRRHGWGSDVQSTLMMYGLFAGMMGVMVLSVLRPDGLPVRGYGVMLLLAVVAGVWLAMRRAQQVGADPEIIVSLAFPLMIAGILGARGLYIAEYWEQFARPTFLATLGSVLNVTQGGLVVYGSLIGASLAFVWYVRKYRLPLLAMTDLLVASLVLGQGIGRLGCFLNGCCFGGLCTNPDLPAVQFPWGSPPVVRQVSQGQLDVDGLLFQGDETAEPTVAAVVPRSRAAKKGIAAGDRILAVSFAAEPGLKDFKPVKKLGDVYDALFDENAPRAPPALKLTGPDSRSIVFRPQPPLPRSRPVHPTQLYSAFNGMLLALFAWAYFPFRHRDGEVFAWLLTIFPVTRFLMEWVRTDEPGNFPLGMTISQTISVGLLLSAVVWWYVVLRQPRDSKLSPADWARINQRWAGEPRS